MTRVARCLGAFPGPSSPRLVPVGPPSAARMIAPPPPFLTLAFFLIFFSRIQGSLIITLLWTLHPIILLLQPKENDLRVNCFSIFIVSISTGSIPMTCMSILPRLPS